MANEPAIGQRSTRTERARGVIVKWNQRERRTRSLPSPLWGGSARSAGVGVVRRSADGPPPQPLPTRGRGAHRVRGVFTPHLNALWRSGVAAAATMRDHREQDQDQWNDTMSNIDAELARLIAPGRVHRRLYTDPAIFELEMDRIFGAAWVYVGHESQIKKPGDYFATRMGRKPVVIVRD